MKENARWLQLIPIFQININLEGFAFHPPKNTLLILTAISSPSLEYRMSHLWIGAWNLIVGSKKCWFCDVQNFLKEDPSPKIWFEISGRDKSTTSIVLCPANPTTSDTRWWFNHVTLDIVPRTLLKLQSFQTVLWHEVVPQQQTWFLILPLPAYHKLSPLWGMVVRSSNLGQIVPTFPERIQW